MEKSKAGIKVDQCVIIVGLTYIGGIMSHIAGIMVCFCTGISAFF